MSSMSERLLPMRTNERSRQEPHLEKLADSSEESFERKLELEKLENKLTNLKHLRDIAQYETDLHWQKAKKYQAKGRMDLALEAKAMCEKQAEDYKKYNSIIRKYMDRIVQLSKLRPGPQMGVNYAMVKMDRRMSE